MTSSGAFTQAFSQPIRSARPVEIRDVLLVPSLDVGAHAAFMSTPFATNLGAPCAVAATTRSSGISARPPIETGLVHHGTTHPVPGIRLRESAVDKVLTSLGHPSARSRVVRPGETTIQNSTASVWPRLRHPSTRSLSATSTSP